MGGTPHDDGSRLLVLGPALRHVGTTTATVWVETSRPAEVEILGHTARTFEVCGEHYALVVIRGLEPDSSRTYQVHVDGQLVWPMEHLGLPESRIRTRPGTDVVGNPRTQRVVFGSCRFPPTGDQELEDSLGVDALDAYAARLIARVRGCADESEVLDRLPDALLLLGDQIYADETTPRTQEWIREKRGGDTGAGMEIADYPEYAHLYRESWVDPEVRWLFSTAPTAMIFDDHDVRDDWNTSVAWREQMAQLPWWPERIRAGIASYWVYQHLGNLDPDTLADDELYRKITEAEGDVYPLLEQFAARADEAVGHPVGLRWSYRWDLGRTRLLMIDTRCGRVLNADERLMVNDHTFTWIEEQTADAPDEVDHLLLGSSIPWLMPPAADQIQAMNERSCANGGRLAEWIRQEVDMEHWPAFRASFDRLARLIERVGASSSAPRTVCVLSGDVHHSYAARASFDTPTRSRVYQLTCSPVRNGVPWFMEYVFAGGWKRPLVGLVRRVGRWWGVPDEPVAWDPVAGPYFGNMIATLEITGGAARIRYERSGEAGELLTVSTVPLT